MTEQGAGRPANRQGRPVYTRRDARDEDGDELCVWYSLGRCPDSDKPACHGQGRKLLHKVRPKKNTISRGLIKIVSLFLLAVCSGSKHITADAMPEDKTGAHAGAGMPSVEPMRRGRQPDEKST